jgi:hypothetical protein
MFIALIKIYDYLFKHPVHSFVIGGATYTRQRSHNLTNWSKSRFHHRYVPFGILGVNGGPHGVLHELHVALVIHQDYRMCPGPVAPFRMLTKMALRKPTPLGARRSSSGSGRCRSPHFNRSISPATRSSRSGARAMISLNFSRPALTLVKGASGVLLPKANTCAPWYCLVAWGELLWWYPEDLSFVTSIMNRLKAL